MMVSKSLFFCFIISGLILTGTITGAALLHAQSADADLIRGLVVDEDGPVAGAEVRVQATDLVAVTNDVGEFEFNGLIPEETVTLIAWRKNYFLAPTEATPGDESITILMKRHHRTDNLDYLWEASANCGECHTSYAEWQADAHSQSAVNPRFLTMYRGTDVEGNVSPFSDYDGGFPKVPDLTQPYFGPGFKTDFPQRDGNCASCHTPLASNLETNNSCGWSGCHLYVTIERSDELPDGVSPLGLSGVSAEGISCDFCHKIGKISLDKETQLPDHEKPGIQSIRLYRPEPGERFFLGSLEDVARDTDTFSPLYKEGQYCASCHYGVFNDELIYGSYSEWLESAYSAADTGQSCQDCHMPIAERYDASAVTTISPALLWLEQKAGMSLPPMLATLSEQATKNYFVFPDKEGVYRKPDQVHNHTMPGSSDVELLQNAVTLKADAQVDNGSVVISVSITNDKTGHHVPTGSPLRHMMLIVTATDDDGNPLVRQKGPVLPEWTGNYAGQAGKGYAKLLKDDQTEEMPTVAFWREVSIEADTRIPALATDLTEYRFESPEGSSVTVDVQLIYRRAFQQVMEWKKWDDPDILMEEEQLNVPIP